MSHLYIALRPARQRSRELVANVEFGDGPPGIPRCLLRFQVFGAAWEDIEREIRELEMLLIFPGQLTTSIRRRLLAVERIVGWANWQVRQVTNPSRARPYTLTGLRVDRVKRVTSLNLREGQRLQLGAHRVGIAVAQLLEKQFEQAVAPYDRPTEPADVELVLAPAPRRT